MTRRAAVACLLAALACGPAAAEDIATSAPRAHVENVIRDVRGWHDGRHPECPFQRVAAAEVVERKRGGTVERWIVEACDGKRFEYRAYLMTGGGGLSVMVSDFEPDAAPAP